MFRTEKLLLLGWLLIRFTRKSGLGIWQCLYITEERIRTLVMQECELCCLCLSEWGGQCKINRKNSTAARCNALPVQILCKFDLTSPSAAKTSVR